MRNATIVHDLALGLRRNDPQATPPILSVRSFFRRLSPCPNPKPTMSSLRTQPTSVEASVPTFKPGSDTCSPKLSPSTTEPVSSAY